MRIVHFIFVLAITALALSVTYHSPMVFVPVLIIGSLWCFAAASLFRQARWGFVTARAVLSILLLLLLVELGRRVVFIIQNGGMDRADGYGSPMAFLLGVFFELAIFIPTCVFLFWLWRRRRDYAA